MPEIRVWPDSSSVFTWKVGSSSDSFARAMLIFSWSALVFGSTATSITGSGEGHGFEGDRGLLVAQGITGGDVLQAHEGVDVAGFGSIHRVLLVGVHLEDLADAFLLLLGGVEDGVARLDGTGVHAHEHELAVERVGGDS